MEMLCNMQKRTQQNRDLQVCHTFLFVHLLSKTNRASWKDQRKTFGFSKHLMAKIERQKSAFFMGEVHGILFYTFWDEWKSMSMNIMHDFQN